MDGGLDLHSKVTLSGETMDAMWLRNACHCERCRDPETNHQRLDIRDIDVDLMAGQFVLSNGVLHANFSDGHHGLIPWDMLENYRSDPKQSDKPLPEQRNLGPFGDLQHFTFDWFTRGLDSVQQACRTVWSDGALIMHGVEPTGYAMRWVAEMLGNLHGTLHGDVWDSDHGVGHLSGFAGDEMAPPETDLPYTSNPPGMLLYLCVAPPDDGGELTLVDGFALAERVRHQSSELFELLTTVPIPYSFHNNDVALSSASPIVTLEANGTYSTARHAPRLAGLPRVDDGQERQIYSMLGRWLDLVEVTTSWDKITLEAGDLLVIDNHRMIHGREPFTDTTDRPRSLLGCYVASDGMQSRVALTQLGYPLSNQPPGFCEANREIGDDAYDPSEPTEGAATAD